MPTDDSRWSEDTVALGVDHRDPSETSEDAADQEERPSDQGDDCWGEETVAFRIDAAEGVAVPERPVGRRQPARRPHLVLLAIVGVVVLVVAIGSVFGGGREVPTPPPTVDRRDLSRKQMREVAPVRSREDMRKAEEARSARQGRRGRLKSRNDRTPKAVEREAPPPPETAPAPEYVHEPEPEYVPDYLPEPAPAPEAAPPPASSSTPPAVEFGM